MSLRSHSRDVEELQKWIRLSVMQGRRACASVATEGPVCYVSTQHNRYGTPIFNWDIGHAGEGGAWWVSVAQTNEEEKWPRRDGEDTATRPRLILQVLNDHDSTSKQQHNLDKIL